MADEPQQAKETPVTDTQVTPTPSVEQKTPDVVEETKQDGLPQEASDRTKSRFDELTSQLREERQRREAVESAFRSMQPKQPAQGFTPIIDPDTGYLNESALAERDKMLLEAQQRATKAEQAVQSYQLEVENRMAYDAHPDLNPNDKKQFDQKLHQQARAIILDSMINPQDYEGKQLSLKEAGDYLKGKSQSAVEEAKKQGAVEAIEQLTPKEQAALEATGTPAGRSDVATNLETLRLQTRKGNPDAIIARMRALREQV